MRKWNKWIAACTLMGSSFLPFAKAAPAEAVWASTNQCPIGHIWVNNVIVGSTVFCWATTTNTGMKSVRIVQGCRTYNGGTAYVGSPWKGLASSPYPQQKTGTSSIDCRSAIGVSSSKIQGGSWLEWSSFDFS